MGKSALFEDGEDEVPFASPVSLLSFPLSFLDYPAVGGDFRNGGVLLVLLVSSKGRRTWGNYLLV